MSASVHPSEVRFLVLAFVLDGTGSLATRSVVHLSEVRLVVSASILDSDSSPMTRNKSRSLNSKSLHSSRLYSVSDWQWFAGHKANLSGTELLVSYVCTRQQ